MFHSRKLIVPALLALGVFGAAPIVSGLTGAIADGNQTNGVSAAGLAPGGSGDSKNGGTNKNGGGNGDTSKNGGGNGDTSKNGGGNGGTNKNGGDIGGTNKNGGDIGGGNRPSGGGDNGGRGGNGHGRGGNGERDFQSGFSFGGGSSAEDYSGRQTITCVVNGQLIPVRSVSECRYGRGFVHNGDSYFGGGEFGSQTHYRQRKVLHRQYRFDMGMPSSRGFEGYNTGYSFGFGGKDAGTTGYGVRGSIFVGSRAAVMQAQRRARESAYGLGGESAYGNDGGYAAGYNFGAGYDQQGGDGYGIGYGRQDGDGLRRHHGRHTRHMHQHAFAGGNMGGYNFGAGVGGCGCYNPGYVVHHGPTISKDGGY